MSKTQAMTAEEFRKFMRGQKPQGGKTIQVHQPAVDPEQLQEMKEDLVQKRKPRRAGTRADLPTIEQALRSMGDFFDLPAKQVEFYINQNKATGYLRERP